MVRNSDRYKSSEKKIFSKNINGYFLGNYNIIGRCENINENLEGVSAISKNNSKFIISRSNRYINISAKKKQFK